jgi:peptidoglycan/xylan/chitin deacetylase (PgdA/CDA1 family)
MKRLGSYLGIRKCRDDAVAFRRSCRLAQAALFNSRFPRLATLAPNAEPPLILSFDDGYKDFIEVVVRILERHRVIANQNIVVNSVESGRPPMNG